MGLELPKINGYIVANGYCDIVTSKLDGTVTATAHLDMLDPNSQHNNSRYLVTDGGERGEYCYKEAVYAVECMRSCPPHVQTAVDRATRDGDHIDLTAIDCVSGLKFA